MSFAGAPFLMGFDQNVFLVTQRVVGTYDNWKQVHQVQVLGFKAKADRYVGT